MFLFDALRLCLAKKENPQTLPGLRAGGKQRASSACPCLRRSWQAAIPWTQFGRIQANYYKKLERSFVRKSAGLAFLRESPNKRQKRVHVARQVQKGIVGGRQR